MQIKSSEFNCCLLVPDQQLSTEVRNRQVTSIFRSSAPAFPILLLIQVSVKAELWEKAKYSHSTHLNTGLGQGDQKKLICLPDPLL